MKPNLNPLHGRDHVTSPLLHSPVEFAKYSKWPPKVLSEFERKGLIVMTDDGLVLVQATLERIRQWQALPPERPAPGAGGSHAR